LQREEEIKDHLAAYRQTTGKTQKQMAAHIGVAYATYQQMEKGIIKTPEAFQKFVERTDFHPTQDSMYYISGFTIPANQSEVISVTIAELAAIKAIIKVLTLKIIKLESKSTKQDFDHVSLALEKTTKEVYDQLLDELRKGKPFSFL
jgi:DNA-binding XRE family transcriptional regulator